MDTLKQLTQKINQFRDDRNWRQFHNEKDLALSVVLEAAELLENFQWKEASEAVNANLENIKDELADVMIYCMMIADNLDLDVAKIIQAKIEKNALKYPIQEAKGRSDKYNKL